MDQDMIDALLRERAGYALKGDADSVAQVDEQLEHYGYDGIDELETVEPRNTDADESQEDPLMEALRSENAALRAERDTANTERDQLRDKVTELEKAAADRAAAGGPAPVDAKPAPAKATRTTK